METTICHSSENIKDETILLDSEEAESFSVNETTFVNEQNTGRGCQVQEIIESPKQSECLGQKAISPSIIEQAYNVMKYLFSPEKNTTKIANPVQPDISETPCNSILNSVPNRVGFCTPETETDFSPIAHPASSDNRSISDKIEMNQLGILQSSLNFDIHNSTADDSYLTTVSLIDESFQSAVTHLDENTEILKNTTNIHNNNYNNSPVLNNLEACNETLENSLYCLENTMLRNGSFISEGTKVEDIFSENKDENLENFDVTRVLECNKGIEKEKMIIKDNQKFIKNDAMIIENIQIKNEAAPQIVVSLITEENKVNNNVANMIIECDKQNDEVQEKNAISNFNELDNSGFNKEKESVRKLFENMSISSPQSKKSVESEIAFQKSFQIGDDNNFQSFKSEEDIKIKNVCNMIVECDNSNGHVQESISTSTVVLSSVDSLELDNLLLSLKNEGSETNSSSLTSLEGEEIASILSTNSYVKNSEVSSGSPLPENGKSDDRFEKKISKSEGSSPNKEETTNKGNFNKSIDHSLCRSSSESPKLKNTLLEKGMVQSYVDIPLVNLHSMNSDKAKVGETFELKLILNPNFGAHQEKNREPKSHYQSDCQSVSLSSSAVSEVISQNSYTVLNNSDLSLNRPIIDSPEDIDCKMKSNTTFTKTLEMEDVSSEISENVFAVSTPQHLISCTEVIDKSVTSDIRPVKCSETLEEISGSGNAFKVENPSDDKEHIASSFNKNGPVIISCLNEELTQFSPITPINDNPFLRCDSEEKKDDSLQNFSPLNSTIVFSSNQENEINHTSKKSLNPSTHILPNETFVSESGPVKQANDTPNKNLDSVPDKLNKRSDHSPRNKMSKSANEKLETPQGKKKLESPKKQSQLTKTKSGSPRNKLNQTFEKKLESSNLGKPNETFDKKSQSPPLLNETFDKKSQSPPLLNETFDKKSQSPPLLNETFEKKLDLSRPNLLNETYDKKQPLSLNASNQIFEKRQKLSSTSKLNETFDKKPDSLVLNKLNQTFVKKEESSTSMSLNQTFDKNTNPQQFSNLNETFVKRMEFPPGCDKFVQEMDKNSNSHSLNTLNKTFDKSRSPTPDATQNRTYNKAFDKLSESPAMNKMNLSLDKQYKVAESEINETKKHELSNSYNPQKNNIKEVNDSFSKELKVDLNKLNSFNSTIDFGKELIDTNLLTQPKTDQDKNISPPETSVSTKSHDLSTNEDTEFLCPKDLNGSFVSTTSSNTSLLGTCNSTVLHQGEFSNNPIIDDLLGKMEELNIGQSFNADLKDNSHCSENKDKIMRTENDLIKNDKLQCDPDLVQLIQEQFSSTDIEKICSVVDVMSSKNLSHQILKADDSFLKSQIQGDFKQPENDPKPDKFTDLSPHSFDFLNSIRGKPTGRDLSRESLYVKFDPLVQPPNANSLIDFTKEVEALQTSEDLSQHNVSSDVCEQLLAISPEKRPDEIVPPLTPLTHKNKNSIKEDRIERLKELQNEIYFLKNLYSEREKTNKLKMDEYESQIAKLTGQSCLLEDRLKESSEREKSLVKKLKEQTQSMNQLKVIMEEYIKVISRLTAQLEAMKNENVKQIENLTSEKESYVTHLQNTEAAFTDVHAKYEKSKKTIASLKANEMMYRNKISEQCQKLEDFKERAREAQEKAFKEFQKVQEELNNMRTNQAQETARLRAQLRKTELKLEAMQESLDQKIKENEQLTAICDELIEGKK